MNRELVKRTQEAVARSRATLIRSRALLEESNQLCAMIRNLAQAHREGRPIARLGMWMTPSDELRQIKTDQIQMKRNAAARSRRLAITFWSAKDRNNALTLAGTLEAEADELARVLAAEDA